MNPEDIPNSSHMSYINQIIGSSGIVAGLQHAFPTLKSLSEIDDDTNFISCQHGGAEVVESYEPKESPVPGMMEELEKHTGKRFYIRIFSDKSGEFGRQKAHEKDHDIVVFHFKDFPECIQQLEDMLKHYRNLSTLTS
jgi:hypothetical protein